jgi:hypothetical protein
MWPVFNFPLLFPGSGRSLFWVSNPVQFWPQLVDGWYHHGSSLLISFSLGWCALDCLSRACVQEIKSLFWFSRLVTGTCLALYSWENQIFILLLFVGLQVATHKVAAFRVTRQVLPLIFLQCCSALGFLRLGEIQSSVAGKLAFGLDTVLHRTSRRCVLSVLCSVSASRQILFFLICWGFL